MQTCVFVKESILIKFTIYRSGSQPFLMHSSLCSFWSFSFLPCTGSLAIINYNRNNGLYWRQ